MHKGQEWTNVKSYYEFGYDWMKMCFKQKTKMKFDETIKDNLII